MAIWRTPMAMSGTLSRCALLLPSLLAFGCASALPERAPPLAEMVEPLEFFAEPDDEAARRDLPLGSFTGAYVGDARDSLDALLGEPEGVEVVRIVENSPADIAGLREGDLLLEARVDGGAPRRLQYPSQWRELELETPPGREIAVVFDRANRRSQATLTNVPRVRSLARTDAERVREEERIGVVLRTATEVEARAAGLGPGGGAVVVGLARRSPWRAAGLAFGDLVIALDGREIADLDVALEAIRAADERIAVVLVRSGERIELETPLSRRASELREFSLPLVYSYEADRGRTEWSFLLGLVGWESTEAAWRFRFLWFASIGGGEADRLIEVGS